METEVGWKDGIIAVLNAANAPMHYVEIAEQIFERPANRTNRDASRYGRCYDCVVVQE